MAEETRGVNFILTIPPNNLEIVLVMLHLFVRGGATDGEAAACGPNRR
jgi:hypothetical protein